MEKKRILARWQFEKSNEQMKALEGAAEMLLEMMNDGTIDAAETLKRLLSLADRAVECGIDLDRSQMRRVVEEEFLEGCADAHKGEYLFSSKGSGSIARLFEGYEGTYEDYVDNHK